MSDINLTLINLHDKDEFDELTSQRIACGWDFSQSDVETMRNAIDQKIKSTFWITLSDNPTRIGHISLDSYTSPPDPQLALADKSIMTVQTFFILKHHQGGGIGNKVMNVIESMAQKEPYGSPDCKIVTVNTLSKACFDRNLPGWLDLWKRKGEERPEWSFWSKEDWYVKRGYVKFKEEVRFGGDMDEAKVAPFVAACLRKNLT